MTNEQKFIDRQNKERNIIVNELRTKQGIKELFAKKSKLTLFLLFIVITICIWLLFIYSDDLNIIRLLIYIAYWMLFALCIWGILMWFGKPKNAQKIEDDIKDIFNIKEAHKVPILKSIIKKFNGKFTYELYSPDYSKEKYEAKRLDIEQKLGIAIIGGIESYEKFIYFDAVPKKSIKAKGELKDDRI